MAWQCTSPEVILKGFTIDESDDDMLWNGSEDDGHVRGECEVDKGTDCEGWDIDTDYWR